ncbi:auxin-induced protein 6B-like [Ipomoea triloba]|uniref:auxin-induced protein 6B-like n=1 Tax=Ipomoea triloba TaxID=35885 RepID=UPI00125D7230|nr:auxin-induced protein 6B-like [Ipomoea triloba]
MKTVVEMFQKSFLSDKRSMTNHFDEFENSKDHVANDVKEGHFAVMAVDNDKLMRFIVPLSCLRHPTFLRLLEKAAEEYGFEHKGALMLPCRPSELERILELPSNIMEEQIGTLVQVKSLYVQFHLICFLIVN